MLVARSQANTQDINYDNYLCYTSNNFHKVCLIFLFSVTMIPSSNISETNTFCVRKETVAVLRPASPMHLAVKLTWKPIQHKNILETSPKHRQRNYGLWTSAFSMPQDVEAGMLVSCFVFFLFDTSFGRDCVVENVNTRLHTHPATVRLWADLWLLFLTLFQDKSVQ